MKFLAFLLPSLFALSSFFTACGKIDLPSTDDEKTDTTSTDTIDNDSPNVIPDEKETRSVTEVLSITIGTSVWVKGYIVGYCSGTRISSAVFDIPVSTANTNMLLADSPDETDVNRCIPVILEEGLSGNYRENINLYDHPENYKRRIAVYGRLVTYFGVKGIKKIVSYSWCTTDNSSTDEPDDPNTPDNPDDSGGDIPNTPTIDPTPSDSIDGR